MAAGQAGDFQVQSRTGNIPVHEASQKLSQEANGKNQIGMTGVLGGIERVGLVTADGIWHSPEGLWHAAVNEVEHPGHLLSVLGGSAALGAALKVVLPEAGPAGRIAAVAMGAWFIGSSIPGFKDAYSKGLSARTWGELDASGRQWGDVAGQLGVNSALGFAGYKIGAGAAGNVLAREAVTVPLLNRTLDLDMDAFAEWKAGKWTAFDSKLPAFARTIGVAGRPSAPGMSARISDGRAELAGSERAAPADPKAESFDPNTPMRVTLKVARQNQFKFDRMVERIKAGKAEPISREQFNRLYGADPAAMAEARQFAQQHGLRVDGENASARTVTLTGTAGQMRDVFKAELGSYRHPTHGSYIARVGTYSVPEQLAGRITAVLGLDQRAVLRPKFVLASEAAQTHAIIADSQGGHAGVADSGGEGGSRGPAAVKQKPMPADVVMKSYGGDPARYTNRAGRTAFLSFGGTLDQAVPRYLESKGIDPSTLGHIDNTSGGTAPDPQGANVENALDAVDQKLNLREGRVDMISEDNSTQGFVHGIDYVNHAPDGVEYQGSSTSWGGPDQEAWDANGRAELDQSLKDGIALGKTHTFSSGDDGASDRGSLPVQTDYPASSGNGTAVGGTAEYIDASGRRVKEVAWSRNGATGGGVSAVEPRPVYQKFITWISNAGGRSFSGRIVPDISMNASPDTPVEVPTDQGLIGVGGTSSSNPLFQALVRQLSEASGKPIGFVNTMLYRWGQDPVIARKVFNDITVGDNKLGGTGYSAGPGFDAVTGWGSPNFQGMLDELMNPTHPLVSAARRAGYRAYYRGMQTGINVARRPSLIFRLPQGVNIQNIDRRAS